MLHLRRICAPDFAYFLDNEIITSLSKRFLDKLLSDVPIDE